jgi:hypothetical protein
VTLNDRRLDMWWLMDACPNSLSWEAWLVLCALIVVLWAAAIAGATALFHASGRPGGSERRERLEECVGSGQTALESAPLVLDQAGDVRRHAGRAHGRNLHH